MQYPESDLPAAQEMSIYKQCSKIGWRKSILKQLATSKPVISYILKPRGSSKWQVSCLLCDGLQGLISRHFRRQSSVMTNETTDLECSE